VLYELSKMAVSSEYVRISVSASNLNVLSPCSSGKAEENHVRSDLR
jgi:hypothetical protein